MRPGAWVEEMNSAKHLRRGEKVQAQNSATSKMIYEIRSGLFCPAQELYMGQRRFLTLAEIQGVIEVCPITWHA